MNTQDKNENGQVTMEHSPFDDSIEIKSFFSGGKRRETLENMVGAIAEGIPIVTLTGEEGSGKTMICRMVEDRMLSDYTVVFFPQTVDSFEDVVKIVAHRLGIEALSSAAGDTAGLMQAIVSLIHNRGMRLLLIFDEAERIYLATLERIRKMLDLVNEPGLFMQIILSGKMGLHNNFKHLALCNFQQAEEVHFSLDSLTSDETYEYLNQAMCEERAERRGIFTREVAEKIFSSAQGNFRLINALAEESLQALGTDTSFLTLLDSVQKNENKIKPRRRLKSAAPFKKITINKRYLIWASGIACMVLVAVLVFRSVQKPESSTSENVPETKNTIAISRPELIKQTPGSTADVSKEKDVKGDATKIPPASNMMIVPEIKQEQQQPTMAPAEAPQPVDSGKEQLDAQTQGLQDLKKEEGISVKSAEVDRVPEPSREATTTAGAAQPAESKHETSKALGTETGLMMEPKARQAIPMEIAQPSKVEKTQPIISPSLVQSEEKKKEPPGKAIASISPTQLEKEKIKEPREKKVSGEVDQGKEAPSLKVIEARKVVKYRDLPVLVASVTDVREPAKIIKSKEKTKLTEMQSPAKTVADVKRQPTLIPNAIPQVAQVASKIEEVKSGASKKTSEVTKKNESLDRVYNRRIAAGTAWLLGQKNDRYTIQLMVVTSGDAEKKVKDMLAKDNYRGQADKLYILRNESNPDVQYVYYGDYPTMIDARNARNTMPEFLRSHKPYAMSVKGAVRKAQEEE